MTELSRLEVDAASAILVVEAEPTAVSDAALIWAGAGLTVRTTRGQKMRTTDGLFDEFAAALELPQYFGQNWNAFHECLADRDWLAAQIGIAVVLLNAGDVLADDFADLDVFVRSIAHAAESYAAPIEAGEWWDRATVPFHVVLQCTPAEAATVQARWKRAGSAISDFGD